MTSHQALLVEIIEPPQLCQTQSLTRLRGIKELIQATQPLRTEPIEMGCPPNP